MLEVNRKEIGRIGLSMAINYFTCHGYTVSLPLNDTQWYDLIIEKDGVFKTVQCKATQTQENSISLRNTGGTKGVVYDRVINHPNLDYLFCVNKDLKMWNIPVEDIIASGNTNSIILQEKNISSQGFQTYKYQVQFLD